MAMDKVDNIFGTLTIRLRNVIGGEQLVKPHPSISDNWLVASVDLTTGQLENWSGKPGWLTATCTRSDVYSLVGNDGHVVAQRTGDTQAPTSLLRATGNGSMMLMVDSQGVVTNLKAPLDFSFFDGYWLHDEG